MCEGGLRRHAKRSQKTLNDHRTNGSTEYSNKPLRGGDRSWGKDSLLPPNSVLPSPRQHTGAMARNSRTQSSLGARSPSGNTRGGCRGCIPFRLGQSIAKEIPRQFYGMMYLHFCPPRISPKETDGASGGFLPRPLLLRLRNPKIVEVLRKPLSPENCFRKTESFLLVRIGILFVKSSDFV